MYNKQQAILTRKVKNYFKAYVCFWLFLYLKFQQTDLRLLFPFHKQEKHE